MPPIRLHVLGALRVADGDKPIHISRRKAQALLAYLALTGQSHHRDMLAALLWPEANASQARAELRRSIYALRTKLGSSVLTVNSDKLALRGDTLWVDAVEFERLAAGDNAETLRCAVELYQGELLAGFTLRDAPAFEEWRYFEAERLRRLYTAALEKLVRWHAGRDQLETAIEYAARWLASDPLHEPAHRELMRLYARSRNLSAAFRQYEHCRQILEAELGVRPEEPTERLYDQIRSGEYEREPRPRSTVRARERLPVPPTPFIGRAAQLKQVFRLLDNPECRLLTIVGPGGIGKTRLAIRAAQDQIGCFADGVTYVDLSAVEAPSLLAPAMLRALDAPDFGADAPERRLAGRLRDKEMLLLLDNFEHLLDAANLLPKLLQAAPSVKMLVTSRERLNLVGEWLEPLEGLDVSPEVLPGILASPRPSGDAETELEEYDASALFLQCMRRVRPEYAPTADDAQAIARICRLLGGMPLAIELAAAWTRALTLAEIQSEMERGLDILASSLRDVPERHRSMHAVFDSSWTMLPEREQSILRQMSVFRGGCTRQAAGIVTGATLADLSQLVDRSWLRPQALGRYGMHELVRQYCEERLETEHERSAGETALDVRVRHSDYYGEFLSSVIRDTNFRSGALDDLLVEFGNLQTAWLCAAHTTPSVSASEFGPAFHFVGDMMGWFGLTLPLLEAGRAILEERISDLRTDDATREAIRQVLGMVYNGIVYHRMGSLGLLRSAREIVEAFANMAESCSRVEDKTIWRALSTHARANLLYLEGGFEAATRETLDAQAHFRGPRFTCPFLRDRRGRFFWLAQGNWLSARIKWCIGDYDESMWHFRQALRLRDEVGEKRFKGQQMESHVRLLLTTGDYARAEQLAAEGMRLSEEFGDRTGFAKGCLSAGRVARALGRTSDAQDRLVFSLEAGRHSGHLELQLESLAELARLALQQGRPAEARRYLAEAQETFGRIHEPHSNHMAGVWLTLGWTALAEDNASEARAAFVKALANRGRAACETMEGLAGLAEVAAVEGDASEAAELLGLVAEHRFTAHALRQQAAQRLSDLEQELGPSEYAQRRAAGRMCKLECVLNALARA